MGENNTEWMRSPLTDWERDLLSMDMCDVPVRGTTADGNTSVADEEDWVTRNSHPWSGLQYQEWNGLARVTQRDAEVVSPSQDTDNVYRQYLGRVSREIGE